MKTTFVDITKKLYPDGGRPGIVGVLRQVGMLRVGEEQQGSGLRGRERSRILRNTIAGNTIAGSSIARNTIVRNAVELLVVGGMTRNSLGRTTNARIVRN